MRVFINFVSPSFHLQVLFIPSQIELSCLFPEPIYFLLLTLLRSHILFTLLFFSFTSTTFISLEIYLVPTPIFLSFIGNIAEVLYS